MLNPFLLPRTNWSIGVTIVQYRDKISETADLIRTGQALHDVTEKHNVPLLINDRVDVALAIGAEGVHIGQDDMGWFKTSCYTSDPSLLITCPDLASARKLLGPQAIIGVTVSTVQEARAAAKGGANYLGIGTMFATPT